jgi:THO complex subunit 1
MVDTVLSRDKNWVRWKAENCPPITREGVSPQMYLQARDTLTKQIESARAPLVNPPGANDLAFLSKVEPLEALKNPSKRHKIPTPEEYYRGIQADELDMDFASTEEEKRDIEERKAGKVWRALRSSKNRFVMCEKVQYGGDCKPLIEEVKTEEHEEHGEKGGEGEGEEEGKEERPESRENGIKAELKSEGETEAEGPTQDDASEKIEPPAPPTDQEESREQPEEGPGTVAKAEDVDMTDVPPSSVTADTVDVKDEDVAATGGDEDRDSGEAD